MQILITRTGDGFIGPEADGMELDRRPLLYLRLCFFLMFSLISVVADAADWYANPSCPNDGDGTAMTCASSAGRAGARKVLYDAINMASAGDTVIAANGTYSSYGPSPYNSAVGWINRSGSVGKVLTIKAANKGQAIVNCGSKAKRGFDANTNVSFVTIQGFTITNCSIGVAINNNNDYFTVSGNHIYDVLQGFSGGSDCDYETVVGNVVHDFGITGDDQYHGIYPRGLNGTVISNVTYNNRGNGWHLHIGSYGTPPSGTWVVSNNTFVGPGKVDRGNIAFYSTSFSALYLQNNIHVNPGGCVIYFSGQTGFTFWFRNNLTYGNGAATLCSASGGSCTAVRVENNIIDKDPWFIEPAVHDYRLQNDSPGVDSGIADLAPTVDIDGADRVGNGYEVGAYENQSIGGLVEPTDLRVIKVTDNVGINSDGSQPE